MDEEAFARRRVDVRRSLLTGRWDATMVESGGRKVEKVHGAADAVVLVRSFGDAMVRVNRRTYALVAEDLGNAADVVLAARSCCWYARILGRRACPPPPSSLPTC